VLQSMGAEDAEGELREIVDSIHLDKLQNVRTRCSFGNTGCRFFLAIHDRYVQPACGHQCDLVLPETIFFAAAGFSKISGSLQAVAIGSMKPGWRRCLG